MNILNKFLKLEFNERFFEIKIKNIHIWHLIRTEIYYKILNEKQIILLKSNSTNNKNSLINIFNLCKNIFKQFGYIFFLKKTDILVFNHPRKIKKNKYYKCIYTDPFLENSSFSYYIFESLHNGKHYLPTKTKNLYYLDEITLISFFLKKAYFIKLNQEEINEINTILSLINYNFKVNLKFTYISKLIKNTIIDYKINSLFFEYILKKTNPKVILEVISYGLNKMILNEVAKKYNIPTIEIQHGTIINNEPKYNFYKKMQLPAYPDYMFLFGEFWKTSANYPIDNSKLFAIGFPNYEENLKKYPKSKTKIKNILFSSQAPIGEKLSKLAINLYKIIDRSEYNIIYKLHPEEYFDWEQKYPELFENDIKVIDNSHKSLYYYYSVSYAHVGVYSTSLFEGLGYDLKTFIFNIYGSQYAEALYKNNLATLVDTPEEIVKKLNENYCKNNSIKNNTIWKLNSIDNFNTIINKFLK